MSRGVMLGVAGSRYALILVSTYNNSVRLNMATSSWRLEDLHQLEELGLAGQLESTRLQEKGICSDQLGVAECASEDLNSVLSDLLMAPTVAAPVHGPSRPRFDVILLAPTANGVKQSSPEVTYINRGQWYEIRLSSCVDKLLNDTTHCRCAVSLSFSELRMRNSERELLDSWVQEHPCERLIDIDRRGCEGVTHIKDSENLNSFSFVWQPVGSAIISVKINCLSSEFVAKKHGGEKGILLQVSVDFYCVATDDHLQRSGCNIKVFKDKGGDRKQKQDNQKVEKLSPSERSMNRPSQDVTRFSVFSVVSEGNHSPPPFSVHSSPSSQSNPCTSSLTPCATLNVLSSVTDVHQWLTARHFSSYLSLFANYSGADLLRLSRQDLRELCGAADGIRLFNALHSQSLCTVYVCLENKTVYQALSLELLTAAEFIAKLTEKVGLKQNEVSSVIQLTNSGILVLVDDTVVRSFCNEDSFVVSAVKDETASYRLVLRRSTHLYQLTPLSAQNTSFDSSTEHS